MKLIFDPYRFTQQEKQKFDKQFLAIASDIRLASLSKKEASTIVSNALGSDSKNQVGVYFWVLHTNRGLFKIYVGKTRSMNRRLSDYVAGFQVHSPNDYKMRLFQAFVFSHISDARFGLFFQRCSLEQYTNCETDALDVYRPLVNERVKADGKARAKVEQGFRDYYDSVFAAKLGA